MVSLPPAEPRPTAVEVLHGALVQLRQPLEDLQRALAVFLAAAEALRQSIPVEGRN